MAGEWLKWSKGLTRKPEILKIAARLMIAPAHAAGCLMQLMEWLDDSISDPDYDESGNAVVTLGALPINFIDGVIGLTGFAESLAEVGWIRRDGEKLLFIHAARHNGKTAKSRALTRDRVVFHRNQEVKRSCNGDTVTTSSLLSSEDRKEGEGRKPEANLALFPDEPPRSKSFSPPSPQEVSEYSRSISYPLDGQAWCDSYAQKGWMIGKAKMKDWRAAVRNWKTNGWKPSGGFQQTGDSIANKPRIPENLRAISQ